MSILSRLRPRAWLLVPLGAIAFLAWADFRRVARVEFVTNLAQEDARPDLSSPTGYTGGRRWLIVPEHNNPTFQWIEETQQMLARGDWRVRYVYNENAPIGREVHSASPYHWWLAVLGWSYHLATGRPVALGVERAALWADPLLQLLLLVGATTFVARRFGAVPAAVIAAGVAFLYPLAAAFLPGVANDFGLLQSVFLWAVVPLVAGALSAGTDGRRLFILAGFAGGCGLWLDASLTVPMIAGIGLGAIFSVFAMGAEGGKPDKSNVLPWRAWALSGAVTSLAAYLVEYFPSHMDPQLRVNYPLYGLSWLGLGELLARISMLRSAGGKTGRARDVAIAAVAAAVVAALPVSLLLSGNHAFLSSDLLATRLTNLPDGVIATGVADWASRDGLSGAFAATVLPAAFILPIAWIMLATGVSKRQRAAIAIALGTTLVPLALSFREIRWWNSTDVVLLIALAASAHALPRRALLAWAVFPAAALVLGLTQLLPAPSGESNSFKFTRAEVEGLYERALSQWIADRSPPGGATVLVPPFRTSSFSFYGSLKGLGTPNWENKEGLSASFRIVTSTRPDETEALINQREISYIVIPSWDPDFDEFARIGLKQPQDSFIAALHQTDGGIFNWLQALPYTQPAIAGFDEQSVLVLAVTDETDPATLRSRLVEYLIEMHQMQQATYSSRALLRYPADLGALVALAQVEKAQEDQEAFAKTFTSLVSNLTSNPNRGLAWDRRVSLAVVLELGGRDDLSRAQTSKCLAGISEVRVRSMTTGSLYHLLVLLRHFEMTIDDPKIQALCMKLLPAELRERM
jgi:hypothetical protein